MRVAALYDIHGNLPALEAVLAEVERVDVDVIVIGGDVVPGFMPEETLTRLQSLGERARFIQGNCEPAILAQLAAPEVDSVSYWGTASGRPLPEPYRAQMRWSAERVRRHAHLFASWPRTLRFEVDGLGDVLFCHATPRSETEIFTRRTPEAKVAAMLEGCAAQVVVCGHTHMPFERWVGNTRVVNAGSIGAPFGEPGAHWALLGPGVELMSTNYDLEHTARLVRASGFPAADEAADELLHPPAEEAMLELYERA